MSFEIQPKSLKEQENDVLLFRQVNHWIQMAVWDGLQRNGFFYKMTHFLLCSGQTLVWRLLQSWEWKKKNKESYCSWSLMDFISKLSVSQKAVF